MRIDSISDIPDALASGLESGGLILREQDLSPALFDLRTGVAGELFQKFTSYQVPLAIVVEDPAAHGARFDELAREHRSHPMVRIYPDHESASAWLAAVRRGA